MLIPNEVRLKTVLKEKVAPLTLSWSRLEARPRTSNFDRSLKAEVRDALWMLTKQWQLGEFEGDDAGSPVVAKLSTVTDDIEKYKADDQAVQPFDKAIPFEAKVEQRPLPFSTLQQDISLDLRLMMGRRWMQLLKAKGLLTATKQWFLDHYGFDMPDPLVKEDAFICAHVEVWQHYAAVAGRMMDGAKFFFDLNATVHYYDQPGFPLTTDHDKFDEAEELFKAWYKDQFYQPDDPTNDAWNPGRLEYQFAISAHPEAGEKVMKGDEYYQGHLDWYNVDVNKPIASLGDLPGNPPPPATQKIVTSLIPTPIMFEGMPNTRWWAFEDSKTNFSYIKPDTTDLAKLLMIEFGLIYANDWYLLPYKLPVGSITKIKGLTLTNSFGENFWIEPAGKEDSTDWARWNMFSMKTVNPNPVQSDIDLLLLPTVTKLQESEPLEEVLFVRDEMANMVWGVETLIPLPSGGSRSGFEAADEYHALLQKLVTDEVGVIVVPAPVADGDEVTKIRYEIMNTIPENWIPFIPTHVQNNIREVQLQRASMPRLLEGESQLGRKPQKIRPRTSLLQPGLVDRKAYFIHEEEIPRSGIRVMQAYQRTRGADGKVYVWYGARKTNGRGEGSSGLGFDRILAKNTDQ
jgi:hypothetical protein